MTGLLASDKHPSEDITDEFQNLRFRHVGTDDIYGVYLKVPGGQILFRCYIDINKIDAAELFALHGLDVRDQNLNDHFFLCDYLTMKYPALDIKVSGQYDVMDATISDGTSVTLKLPLTQFDHEELGKLNLERDRANSYHDKSETQLKLPEAKDYAPIENIHCCNDPEKFHDWAKGKKIYLGDEKGTPLESWKDHWVIVMTTEANGFRGKNETGAESRYSIPMDGAVARWWEYPQVKKLEDATNHLKESLDRKIAKTVYYTSKHNFMLQGKMENGVFSKSSDGVDWHPDEYFDRDTWEARK